MKVRIFLLLLVVVVGGMVMSGCEEAQQQTQKPLPAEWKRNFGGGKLSRLALRNTQLVNFHHQALREVAQRLQALEAKECIGNGEKVNITGKKGFWCDEVEATISKIDPNNPSETDPNN